MPYSPSVPRGMLCALVTLVSSVGHADGIAIVGGSPRAIGRAGAATVGDDGGGALLINPAAMARRDTIRAELGAAMIDDTVHWRTDTPYAPLSVGRAGSQIAPLGALIIGVGDWSFGAGAMTAAVIDRSLPRPSDAHGDLMAAYEYRYTGIGGSYRRDTLSLGVARRLGDSLALGIALGASRVRVTEHRRIWAGAGTTRWVGSQTDDVDLSFDASELFAPSAIAGLLYAPVDSQIELGASVGWARTVHLEGTAAGVGMATGPTVVNSFPPRASLDVRQPIAVRAGGRYVGDRVVAELDGDLWLATAGSGSTMWWIQGMQVVDPMQAPSELQQVPSRIAQHTHVALRTAVDVALIPGFLWVTGGYAFSTRGTPASRLSPSFGDLGGHTVGLGLDTTAGGVTVTLGWSRTWALRTWTPSELRVDNPYGTSGPVPTGTYDGSVDQVGVLIEAELGEH